MKVSSSNKGWHQWWFNLRSDADVPLSPYTGRSFEEALVDAAMKRRKLTPFSRWPSVW
jgi:hypothetical protein